MRRSPQPVGDLLQGLAAQWRAVELRRGTKQTCISSRLVPDRYRKAMKSPPAETGPPTPKQENHEETQAGKEPKVKSQLQSESEKDSGYSDSSSDSQSSEETSVSAWASTAGSSPYTSTAQTAYAPVYILQNVVLKQTRLLVLQPPARRHRKRPCPSSYLPILRSYPRIAPRQAPPPTPAPDPTPTSGSSTPSVNRLPASYLLDVSLRSLSLLRRSRETQRSVRELRAHTRLYERALRGEEGGWERLRRAMELSGGYRKVPKSSMDVDAGETISTGSSSHMDTTPSPTENVNTHETMTSSVKCVTSPETLILKREKENVLY
ncbi:uncharacterized protein [Hyperolius riggenbachi]|uniref:uncharacterized protein isoform X2 n=1 Tax=Hyperolius riggenbachi TaxID=752182 RepID=UPI0035A2B01C